MTEGELLTADFFNRCGQALAGKRWSGILARAITCNSRLIRFYSTAERPIPVAIWRKLAIHFRSVAGSYLRLADRIDAALPPLSADADTPSL